MEYENIGGPFVAANQPCRRAHYKRVVAPDTKHTGPLVGKLVDILSGCVSKNSKMAKFPTTFVPHAHMDLYYNDYKRSHGKEYADNVVRRNNEALVKTADAPAAPKWVATEKNWNHPAMQKLNADYTSKGVRAPVEARIRAYKSAGYPQSYLLKVLKEHDERVKNQPALDEWFDTVMGPYANKKETVPKPKTLKQIFKIKPIKVVMPDQDDVEDEDEEV